MKKEIIGSVGGAVVGGLLAWLLTGVSSPFSPKPDLTFATIDNSAIPPELIGKGIRGDNFTIFLANNGSTSSGPIRIVLSQPPLGRTIKNSLIPPPGEKLDESDETGRYSLAMRPLNENESADVVIWGLTSESLHGVLSGDRLVPQVAAVKPGVGKAYSFSAYVYLLASLVAGVLGFLSGLAFTKGYREGGTDYVEIYERAKAGTGTIQPRATTK